MVAHGLSCPVACGIFPDRRLNPCLLHQQAGSLPLSHQRSPWKIALDLKVPPPPVDPGQRLPKTCGPSTVVFFQAPGLFREQATSETTSLLGACSCPVLASFTASLPRAQTSQITHTEPLPLVCSTASDLRCSTKLGRKIQENTFHDIHLGGKITKTESVVIQTSG